MKKVIVTGGAGFIGSHLAQELAKQNYQVIIIDNLSTGKMENIKGLLTQSSNRENIQFIQENVTELPALQALFKNIDYVFHLAAIASVPASIKDPASSHNVNMTGTLNVLYAAKENKVKKVIYFSSSAVYGDTVILPQREDMPLNPQSPYAVTKIAGEYYCRVFQEVYKLNTICLRYFNIYGPRQDPNSQYAAVIPKFIKQALEGKAPIIFGDGEQTRDFVFAKDAVAAAIAAAENDVTGIYNIGTGRKVTINKLARLVIKVAGKDLQPIHCEPRKGDIKYSLADITRAKAFFSPRYSLEEGVKETLDTLHE